MTPPRHRLVLCAFALIVASWMGAELLTGCQSGLLYLAPAVVLALPLVLGRYVGEQQLVELAARPPARSRRRGVRVESPRSYARVMQRGGRLVASGMAKRPPPAAAPLGIAT
jgi:uncharacterized membrane protein